MDKIINQIKIIDHSGKVDMLNAKEVQLVAFNMRFYELVDYIAQNQNQYLRTLFQIRD